MWFGAFQGYSHMGKLTNTASAVERRYCMTPWVLRLNDMTPQLAGRLPVTDTRLRPDVRALEAGIYDQARLRAS